MALPSPAAVWMFTSTGLRSPWERPSAMLTTLASCSASTKRKSSGKSLRNVSSVDPGLPTMVVRPSWRSRS